MRMVNPASGFSFLWITVCLVSTSTFANFEETLDSILAFKSDKEFIDLSDQEKSGFINVTRGATERDTNNQILKSLEERGVLKHSGNTVEFGGKQLRTQEKFRSIVQMEGSPTFIVVEVTITPTGDTPNIAIERVRKVEYDANKKVRQDIFYGMFGKYVPAYKTVRKYGASNENPPLAPTSEDISHFHGMSEKVWASNSEDGAQTITEALSVAWNCDPSSLFRIKSIRKVKNSKSASDLKNSILSAITEPPYVEKFYQQGKTSTSEFMIEVEGDSANNKKYIWGNIQFGSKSGPKVKFASSFDFDESTKQAIITNHDDGSKNTIKYGDPKVTEKCLSDLNKKLANVGKQIFQAVETPRFCLQPLPENKFSNKTKKVTLATPVSVSVPDAPKRIERTRTFAPKTWKNWFNDCGQAVSYFENLCPGNRAVSIDVGCDFSAGMGDPKVVVNWSFTENLNNVCHVDFADLPSKHSTSRIMKDLEASVFANPARNLSGAKVMMTAGSQNPRTKRWNAPGTITFH